MAKHTRIPGSHLGKLAVVDFVMVRLTPSHAAVVSDLEREPRLSCHLGDLLA